MDNNKWIGGNKRRSGRGNILNRRRWLVACLDLAVGVSSSVLREVLTLTASLHLPFNSVVVPFLSPAMAAVAGRKKSIVSSSNTLLNKAASQSTSLYQQCSSLRSRLLRIRAFSHYFALASSPDSRQSTDPVTQLWDLFSMGIPLCYIFDQLPAEGGFHKINNSQFDPDQYESNPERAKKHAIALFAMEIRKEQVAQSIPGCELFTVTDLWDRNSTDGLVKVRFTLYSCCGIPSFQGQVINTVTAIVDHLSQDAFEASPSSPPSVTSYESPDSIVTDVASSAPPPPADAREAARNNIVREMVETERKYVADLEIMQVGLPLSFVSAFSLWVQEILECFVAKQHH